MPYLSLSSCFTFTSLKVLPRVIRRAFFLAPFGLRCPGAIKLTTHSLTHAARCHMLPLKNP